MTSDPNQETEGTQQIEPLGKYPRILLGFVCLAVVVFFGWLSVVRIHEVSARRVAPELAPLAQVHIQTVQHSTLDNTLEVLGTVESTRRYYMYFNGRGRVASVKSREDGLPLMPGDTVRQGEVLAQLEDEIERAQLVAVQARLRSVSAQLEGALAQQTGAQKLQELAEKDFERMNQLFAAKTTTAEALENSESNLRRAEVEVSTANAQVYIAQAAKAEAEATVGEAQQALLNMKITAPLDGVIAYQHLRVGDFFAPDKLISDPKTLQEQCPMVLIDPNSLWVKARLLPEQAAQVVLGSSVTLVSDTDRGLLYGHGYVAARQPARQVNTKMQEITVVLVEHTPHVAHGALARCIFDVGVEEVLLIGSDALVLRDGKVYAFVLRSDSTVEQRELQVGRLFDSQLEVLSGVEADEQVVTVGRYRLRDAQPVKVVQTQ